ncbi:hypothetical protein V4889_17320 [Ralstonia solanacearum species complex bacterium KE101]|uniref:Uncharacterized protein n=1 Tax=Ralstonia solanacearum TaxID=305 RepID=A0A0S4U6W7_RALSL|nr:hypothetical protein CIG66_14600 [Ralstonia pseudosolanacearum]NKA05998.1 hypothetical protein [Ralstonia solanacearum]NKA52014.1 hypothetical protein [Ralstonia solanacearum]NKA69261.1 hypothetical protein [Ralstonia solanacearum]NKA82455.1 hypothetical protein [Ralstonia solanacearum]
MLTAGTTASTTIELMSGGLALGALYAMGVAYTKSNDGRVRTLAAIDVEKPAPVQKARKKKTRPIEKAGSLAPPLAITTSSPIPCGEQPTAFVWTATGSIILAATSKNAPQAHTIVKNLLDLLGERRPGVDRHVSRPYSKSS